MERRDLLRTLGTIGLSGLLAGCGGGNGGAAVLPRIDYFGSDKSSYRPGEPVIVRCVFEGEGARIEPGGIVATSGVDIALGPLQSSAVLRLVVSYRGREASRELRITVVPNPQFVALAMGFARSSHVAVQGSDGSVYLLGGEGNGGAPPTSVFAFDDAASKFTHAGELLTGRTNHRAVALGDGTILIVGGSITTTGAAYAERFDPRSGRSRPTSSQPAYQRAHHTATALPDGKVLIVGGRAPGQVDASATMELFDPQTDAFSVLPSRLQAGRFGHAAVLATSGTLIIFGGVTPGGTPAPPEVVDLRSFASSTLALPVPDPVPRVGAIALAAGNGNPYVIGGEDYLTGAPAGQIMGIAGSPAAVFLAAALRQPRASHAAAPLKDGRVLVTGGTATSILDPLATTELFSPASRSVEPGPALAVARTHHSATLLPSGRVLVAGGIDRAGNAIATAELYG